MGRGRNGNNGRCTHICGNSDRFKNDEINVRVRDGFKKFVSILSKTRLHEDVVGIICESVIVVILQFSLQGFAHYNLPYYRNFPLRQADNKETQIMRKNISGINFYVYDNDFCANKHSEVNKLTVEFF